MRDQARSENLRQLLTTYLFLFFISILMLTLVSWERRYMQVGANASEIYHLDLIFSGFTEPSPASLQAAYGIEDSLFHKFFRQILRLYISPHNVGAVIDYQLGLSQTENNTCAFVKVSSLSNPESIAFHDAVHGLRRLNIFLFGMLLLLTLAIGRSLFPRNHEFAFLAILIIGFATPLHLSIVQVSPDIFFSLLVTLATLPVVLRQRTTLSFSTLFFSPLSFFGAGVGASGLLASFNLFANTELLPNFFSLTIAPLTLLALRTIFDFLQKREFSYLTTLSLQGSAVVVYSLLSLHFTTTALAEHRRSCMSVLQNQQRVSGFRLQTQDANGDAIDDVTIAHCLRSRFVSLIAKPQENVVDFDIGRIETKDCRQAKETPHSVTLSVSHSVVEPQQFSSLPAHSQFLFLDLDGNKVNERISWKSGERCLLVEKMSTTTNSTKAIRVCPTFGLKLFRFDEHLFLFRLAKLGKDYLYAFNLRSGEITLLLEDLPQDMPVFNQGATGSTAEQAPSILTQITVNFNPGFLKDNSLLGFRTLDIE